MPSLKIVSIRKGDKASPIPDFNPETYAGEAELVQASILEGGMVSGNTSVGFAIKTLEGKYHLIQTSAAIIDALWHAIIVEEEHWKDNPR